MAEDARAPTSGKKEIGRRTPGALEEHLNTLFEGDLPEILEAFEREPAALNEAVTLLRSTLRALEGSRLDEDNVARRIVRARRIADLLWEWARHSTKSGIEPAPLWNLRSALRAAPSTALREEHLERIREADSAASDAFEQIKLYVARHAERAQVGEGRGEEDGNQAPSALLDLRGPSEPPTVNGREKPILTAVQHDVISALLRAGEAGLSKDQLDSQSGHGEARKILKRMRSKDSDWAHVIIMPEKPGRRYRLRLNA